MKQDLEPTMPLQEAPIKDLDEHTSSSDSHHITRQYLKEMFKESKERLTSSLMHLSFLLLPKLLVMIGYSLLVLCPNELLMSYELYDVLNSTTQSVLVLVYFYLLDSCFMIRVSMNLWVFMFEFQWLD